MNNSPPSATEGRVTDGLRGFGFFLFPCYFNNAILLLSTSHQKSATSRYVVVVVVQLLGRESILIATPTIDPKLLQAVVEELCRQA